jgi:hypothetical protein
MPNQVTMYECSYCYRRRYSHESSAKQHEKKCFWNPERRACASCDHQDNETRKCSVCGWDLSKKTELRSDCPFYCEIQTAEF